MLLSLFNSPPDRHIELGTATRGTQHHLFALFVRALLYQAQLPPRTILHLMKSFFKYSPEAKALIQDQHFSLHQFHVFHYNLDVGFFSHCAFRCKWHLISFQAEMLEIPSKHLIACCFLAKEIPYIIGQGETLAAFFFFFY